MIRSFDDPAGKNPGKSNHRALLQSLVRQLSQSQAGRVTDKKADAAQQLVYFGRHRRRPRELPASYGPGSKEEAICFAEVLRAAWEKHPTALKWLELQKVK